jgi:hypothetical protein
VAGLMKQYLPTFASCFSSAFCGAIHTGERFSLFSGRQTDLQRRINTGP